MMQKMPIIDFPENRVIGTITLPERCHREVYVEEAHGHLEQLVAEYPSERQPHERFLRVLRALGHAYAGIRDKSLEIEIANRYAKRYGGLKLAALIHRGNVPSE